MMNEQDEIRGGMDRRTFVKRAGVTGALVWAAPAVTTMSRAFAQDAGSPDCGRPVQRTDTVRLIPTPTDARSGTAALMSNTDLFLWSEGVRTLAGAAVFTGSSTAPTAATLPNRPVAVFLLHSQSVNGAARQTGSVTFDAPILGVAFDQPELQATDAPGITYSASGETGTRRGYEVQGFRRGNWQEPDSFTLGTNSISVSTYQGGFCDQIRIFVDCAPPPTA